MSSLMDMLNDLAGGDVTASGSENSLDRVTGGLQEPNASWLDRMRGGSYAPTDKGDPNEHFYHRGDITPGQVNTGRGLLDDAGSALRDVGGGPVGSALAMLSFLAGPEVGLPAMVVQQGLSHWKNSHDADAQAQTMQKLSSAKADPPIQGRSGKANTLTRGDIASGDTIRMGPNDSLAPDVGGGPISHYHSSDNYAKLLDPTRVGDDLKTVMLLKDKQMEQFKPLLSGLAKRVQDAMNPAELEKAQGEYQKTMDMLDGHATQVAVGALPKYRQDAALAAMGHRSGLGSLTPQDPTKQPAPKAAQPQEEGGYGPLSHPYLYTGAAVIGAMLLAKKAGLGADATKALVEKVAPGATGAAESATAEGAPAAVAAAAKAEAPAVVAEAAPAAVAEAAPAVEEAAFPEKLFQDRIAQLRGKAPSRPSASSNTPFGPAAPISEGPLGLPQLPPTNTSAMTIPPELEQALLQRRQSPLFQRGFSARDFTPGTEAPVSARDALLNLRAQQSAQAPAVRDLPSLINSLDPETIASLQQLPERKRLPALLELFRAKTKGPNYHYR